MKFVKAEKPVTTTHAKLGDLSVDVEVPQVESLEEFSQFAGGNDNAVAFINNAIETAAKNGGRAMLRNAAEDADKTELFAKVQSTTRDYTPGTAQRGVSQKAKAASRRKSCSLCSRRASSRRRDDDRVFSIVLHLAEAERGLQWHGVT
jgi:hypothetical protein